MGKCNGHIRWNRKESGKTTTDREIWWKCNMNNQKYSRLEMFLKVKYWNGDKVLWMYKERKYAVDDK